MLYLGEFILTDRKGKKTEKPKNFLTLKKLYSINRATDVYAWHYSYYDNTPAYIEAEKQARAEKKGLWQDQTPISPYQFRQQSKKR